LNSKLGSGLGEDICVEVGEIKLIEFIFGRVGEDNKEGDEDNDGECDDKECGGK
jgi:hypothetical protein